jgi:glycosyltransferase involved in cell wall biosynthesis
VHVAAAGHVTEVSGPVQALYNHLRRTAAHFSFAKHPFGYSSVEASVFEHWHGDRRLVLREARSPRVLSVARDILCNLWWFGTRERSDIFVGIDNVNACCGLILRAFGRTGRCIYYVIDYTPRRFENGFLNWLYHAVDRFVALRCDEVWNISERIAQVRRHQGVAENANRVVGVGVDFSYIVPSSTKNIHDLVLMSHLTESKGVQLAIKAIGLVRSRVPDARLLIIGTGPYENTLKDLVKECALGDSVQFFGLMNHEQLFSFLPKCGIALAPYVNDPASITYYADPTKPKEYLACGLPVIITDVPWIAQEIAKRPMGLCIEYDVEQLAQAAVKLMTDQVFYDECATNALAYVKDMAWDSIYRRVLVGPAN